MPHNLTHLKSFLEDELAYAKRISSDPELSRYTDFYRGVLYAYHRVVSLLLKNTHD